MEEQTPYIFGAPDPSLVNEANKHFQHSANLLNVVMDKEALNTPETLDELIAKFPNNILRDFDLFLILAECMANALSYSNPDLLGLHARKRDRLLLVSIYHDPPLVDTVDYVLRNVHDGWLPNYETDPPKGLGFPILFRLAYQITISHDRTRLQLWIRLHDAAKPVSL